MGEYNFCLSVAETVEQARQLLREQSDKNKIEIENLEILYEEAYEKEKHLPCSERKEMSKIFRLKERDDLYILPYEKKNHLVVHKYLLKKNLIMY
jgi:hypothetical protein